MKMLLVVGLALLLTPSPGQAAESPANPIELRIGQSHGVDGLVIGFDAVNQDSRCPRMVMCVWEGDAEVSLWAESPGFAIEEFVLNTHPDGVQEVKVFDHFVRIVALDPYPVFPGPIHPSLYLLTLRVERAARTSADAVSMGMAKGRYRY